MLNKTPSVPGLPYFGSAFRMAKSPAEFFVHCYRTYGPVCRLRVLGHEYVLLSGVEAANFMGTRAGKDCLRSKAFWDGLVREYGATRMLTGEDGDSHKELRDIMRNGYSRESIKGRCNELVAITDGSLMRDWPVGKNVRVVHAMQYMVVDQLGTILTGAAPLEYVKDIRTAIMYILNVLVTRQRPAILLKRPEYRKAKRRVMELGEQMIRDATARYASTRPEDRNLVDDIMAAHIETPEKMPASDLIVSLTGPYVAGLDTVANTTSAVLYCVLKHPDVKARILDEVDALFEAGDLDEERLLKKLPALNGAIMETVSTRSPSHRCAPQTRTLCSKAIKFMKARGSTSAQACRTSWRNTGPRPRPSTSTVIRSHAPSICGRACTHLSAAARTPAWARAWPKCRWHCRWPACFTSWIWNWSHPTTCSRPSPRPHPVRRWTSRFA